MIKYQRPPILVRFHSNSVILSIKNPIPKFKMFPNKSATHTGPKSSMSSNAGDVIRTHVDFRETEERGKKAKSQALYPLCYLSSLISEGYISIYFLHDNLRLLARGQVKMCSTAKNSFKKTFSASFGV